MIVRSNIITRGDVCDAVLTTPGLGFQDTYSREGWFVPVREFTPQRFSRGYEFFLTGSSPYNVNRGNRDEKAATWDEWGVVIAKLFAVDPDAQIGHYSDEIDFLRQTRDEHVRVTAWHDPESYYARTHRAPWLQAA